MFEIRSILPITSCASFTGTLGYLMTHNADAGLALVGSAIVASATYVMGIAISEIADSPARARHQASLPAYWAQYGLPPQD